MPDNNPLNPVCLFSLNLKMFLSKKIEAFPFLSTFFKSPFLFSYNLNRLQYILFYFLIFLHAETIPNTQPRWMSQWPSVSSSCLWPWNISKQWFSLFVFLQFLTAVFLPIQLLVEGISQCVWRLQISPASCRQVLVKVNLCIVPTNDLCSTEMQAQKCPEKRHLRSQKQKKLHFCKPDCPFWGLWRPLEEGSTLFLSHTYRNRNINKQWNKHQTYKYLCGWLWVKTNLNWQIISINLISNRETFLHSCAVGALRLLSWSAVQTWCFYCVIHFTTICKMFHLVICRWSDQLTSWSDRVCAGFKYMWNGILLQFFIDNK